MLITIKATDKAGHAKTITLDCPVSASSSGMLVGARAKTLSGDLSADFTAAQSKLGPLQVTRVFYGSLPAQHTRISPAGVLEVISYKSGGSNLEAFVRSLKNGEQLALHHEPEGPTDYPDGATFVRAWDADYDRVKTAAPGVKFGMIAGGYQYRANGGRGYDGSFLPPRADWYAVDTYRDGSSETGFGAIVPLTDVAEFQRWYTLVKDRGKPLMVTEYGRGTVGNGEVPSTPSRRLQVLPVDVQWLNAHGFAALSLWYSDYGPDGRAWCPTDAGYYAAFKALPRG